MLIIIQASFGQNTSLNNVPVVQDASGPGLLVGERDGKLTAHAPAYGAGSRAPDQHARHHGWVSNSLRGVGLCFQAVVRARKRPFSHRPPLSQLNSLT